MMWRQSSIICLASLLLSNQQSTTRAWVAAPMHNSGVRQPAWKHPKKKQYLTSTIGDTRNLESRGFKLISRLNVSNNRVKPFQRVRFVAATLGLVAVLMGALSLPKSASAAAASSVAAATSSSVQGGTMISAVPVVATPVATAPVMLTSGLSKVNELRISFRLLYSSLLGSVVGWERSSTNHSAGVRTMSLVSLGAAAFTICSMYGFAGSRFDPSRMASSVASGVGFIGAGVITTHKVVMQQQQPYRNASQQASVVHGLTTAAAIWISAAVGVASGVGLYYIATTAALATVSILRFGRHNKQDEDITAAQEQRQGQMELHKDREYFIPGPDVIPARRSRSNVESSIARSTRQQTTEPAVQRDSSEIDLVRNKDYSEVFEDELEDDEVPDSMDAPFLQNFKTELPNEEIGPVLVEELLSSMSNQSTPIYQSRRRSGP